MVKILNTIELIQINGRIIKKPSVEPSIGWLKMKKSSRLCNLLDF